MTIIAWIMLGVATSILAQTVLGARFGTGANLLLGVAGAVLGGWLASVMLDVDVMRGFVHPTTWITAVVASLVLLLICHALSNHSHDYVLRRH